MGKIAAAGPDREARVGGGRRATRQRGQRANRQAVRRLRVHGEEHRPGEGIKRFHGRSPAKS